MKLHQVVQLLILEAILIISFAQVQSLKFDFPTFYKENETKLHEYNSYIIKNAIQVTPDVSGASIENESGRALYIERFRLRSKNKLKKATFNTTFVINVSNRTNAGGEGLAFILTEQKDLPPNSSGQWLAIVNEKTNGASSSRIVAVEFDTRKNNPDDLDDNHVGLDVNSIKSVVHKSLSRHGIKIAEGVDLAVHVQYDGKNISVYVSKNVEAHPKQDFNLVFSEAIDLSAYLPPKVYVGFSGSTSNETELNCVKSWKFEGLEIDEDSELLWVWITIPFLALVFLGLLFRFYWNWKARRGEEQKAYPDIETELNYYSLNPRKFKLRELKKATANFSPKNKLGQGGFGMVFKGTWKNREVAVKRVSEKSLQGRQEFISEITTIGNLNHRNLVKLLGWCFENKELLLVYEHMSNGSLDRYIFLDDKPGRRESNLSWETRLNVIHGLAHALEYLHNGCDKRILHRDIKASNVMLDSDFNAKLGDFGLARMIQGSEMTHHSTKEIAGTPGYMAPETFLNGRATVETDVYAFGVLMLEVVSGKRPGYCANQQNNYKNNIVHWLWELYQNGAILDAADPRLDSDFDEQEMTRVLISGLACCHPNPNQRPPMRRILKVLMGEADPPNVPAERPAFMWPALPPSFNVLDLSVTGSQVTLATELTGR